MEDSPYSTSKNSGGLRKASETRKKTAGFIPVRPPSAPLLCANQTRSALSTSAVSQHNDSSRSQDQPVADRVATWMYEIGPEEHVQYSSTEPEPWSSSGARTDDQDRTPFSIGLTGSDASHDGDSTGPRRRDAGAGGGSDVTRSSLATQATTEDEDKYEDFSKTRGKPVTMPPTQGDKIPTQGEIELSRQGTRIGTDISGTTDPLDNSPSGVNTVTSGETLSSENGSQQRSGSFRRDSLFGTANTLRKYLKWKNKKKAKDSGLADMAVNDEHMQYIQDHLDKVAVEIPRYLVRETQEEAFSIVTRTAKHYQQATGHRSELTTDAVNMLEDLSFKMHGQADFTHY